MLDLKLNSISYFPGSSMDASQTLQKRAAEVLSNLKNFCRTSQTAVDRVVSGVNELTDLYLEVVKVREFLTLLTVLHLFILLFCELIICFLTILLYFHLSHFSLQCIFI